MDTITGMMDRYDLDPVTVKYYLEARYYSRGGEVLPELIDDDTPNSEITLSLGSTLSALVSIYSNYIV